MIFSKGHLNRKFLVSIIVLLLFQGFLIYTNEGHSRSIKDILVDIREEQGVTKNSRIDPDKVSDRLLEELGEAVMSIIHPDEREHDFMDEMMGGEGSDSLKAMHKAMGYDYLSGENYNPGDMINRDYYGRYKIMNWNMHGRNHHYPWRMKNWFYNWHIGGVIMWILILLFFGAIGFIIYLLIKKRNTFDDNNEPAIVILKKRYARGEITKEQFDEMKKTLL